VGGLICANLAAARNLQGFLNKRFGSRIQIWGCMLEGIDTFRRSRFVTTNQILRRAVGGVTVVALLAGVNRTAAEEPDPGSTSGLDCEAVVAAPEVNDGTRLARLLKEASLAPGVGDVVRLVRSGTDTSVVIAHVQASDHTFKLRPEDIEHLNDHGVPDSIVASMIVRRAELRAQAPQVRPHSPVIHPPQPVIAETVKFVRAPTPQKSPQSSSVTVIGRSDLQRGLSYRNHFYSARNFYSGTYGRAYASYNRYCGHGPVFRGTHGPRFRR
jgi:hypothetical protein